MMGKAVMPALQRIDWRFGVINEGQNGTGVFGGREF